MQSVRGYWRTVIQKISEYPSCWNPDLRDEVSKIEAEPLLPIEKKLIGWSLGIGVTLLTILAIVNHFFPAAP